MKKYIKPNTEIVEVAISQALLGGSVEATVTETTQSNESALGRQYSNFDIWEDDEEEY